MADVKLEVSEGEMARVVAGSICRISLGRIDSKVPIELEPGPPLDEGNKFWPEVEVPPPTYISSD